MLASLHFRIVPNVHAELGLLRKIGVAAACFPRLATATRPFLEREECLRCLAGDAGYLAAAVLGQRSFTCLAAGRCELAECFHGVTQYVLGIVLASLHYCRLPIAFAASSRAWWYVGTGGSFPSLYLSVMSSRWYGQK